MKGWKDAISHFDDGKKISAHVCSGFDSTFAPVLTAGVTLLGTMLLGAGSAERAQAQAPPASEPVSKPSALSGVGLKMYFTAMPENGTPIVTFRINDTTDAKFAVTTGSAASFISARLAKKLGLPIEYRPEPSGSKTPIVTFDKMAVGEDAESVQFFKAPFIVDEKAQAFNAQTDPFYDGTIGGNVLHSLAAVFDYETNQIVLATGNLNDEQLRYLGVADGSRAGIPLIADDQYKLTYHVPVHVGKNTYSILLDSANRITTLLDKDKKLKLDRAYRVPVGAVGLPSYLLTTSEFGLGDAAQTKTAAELLQPLEIGVNTSPNPSQTPLLGLDYLSQFRVIIDYPAEKLYTVPLANRAHLAFPTDVAQECAVRSTDDGTFYPTKQGKWTFTRIEKNGLFGKAGIQNGDVIETINGKKTDGLRVSALMSLFHALSYADEMVLSRDGKPLKVVIDKH